MLGAILAQIFMYFAYIIEVLFGFSGILPKFSTNQNFGGAMHTASYTTAFEGLKWPAA